MQQQPTQVIVYQSQAEAAFDQWLMDSGYWAVFAVAVLFLFAVVAAYVHKLWRAGKNKPYRWR